jgi:hypothetical protein
LAAEGIWKTTALGEWPVDTEGRTTALGERPVDAEGRTTVVLF